MSLAIQLSSVTWALLAGGGWFPVKRGTFDVDAFEFLDGDDIVHGGGRSGICASGFEFVDADKNVTISGPLTSLLAVRYERENPGDQAADA